MIPPPLRRTDTRMNVTLRVNGNERTLDVEPRLLLVQALREDSA